MVNKLLIGLGLVALVAVGSIGVWKLADGGDRRAGALGEDKPLAEGPTGALRWRGPFDAESAYKSMDVVSYEGSSWIATADSEKATVPPEEPWDLLAQAGTAGESGPQGPAGSSSGTLQSPNGSYSLVVANDGIVMNGPGGTIALRDNVLELRSEGAMTIQVSGNLTGNVGANTTFTSGGAMSASVDGAMTLDVDSNLTVDIANSTTFMTGNALTTQAGGVMNLRGAPLRLNCPAGGSLVPGSQTVRVC